MGNIQGQFDVGSFYNITAAAPLDVRTLVKTESDLIAEDSWNKKTHPVYKGMMVTVQETGNVYTLIDVDNVHSIDGWKKLGSDSDSSPFEKGDAENSAVLKGGNNQTTCANEVALGKYNKSNSSTYFSVGIGTSDTDRKNAFEVKQNGDIYIEGVGGYDGTNTDESEDVATVITRVSATPDWNAKEGEAGYIENRTHYINTKDGVEHTLSDLDYIDINEDGGKEWYYHGGQNNFGIAFKDYHGILKYNDITSEEKILYKDPDDSEIILTVRQVIEEDDATIVFRAEYPGFNNFKFLLFENADNPVVTLDPQYIPNTVCSYKQVNHGTSNTTFTLTSNTFHVWDKVANLTLTLGLETKGVVNEYIFQFTSGTTATSLTLPNNIKWANGETPVFETNTTYQVSIVNNLGIVQNFK